MATNIRPTITAAVIAASLMSATPSAGKKLPEAVSVQGAGEYVNVIDGDTLDFAGVRVRLWGVAAPELNEPGGYEAKGWLRAFLRGDHIQCYLSGEKSRDRHVSSTCFLGNSTVIQVELVKAGMARDCPRYSKSLYADFETPASKALPLPKYCKVKND